MDVRFVVSFLDHSGQLATVTMTPPQDTAHADILAGVSRVCQRLDANSTAEIVKARIIYDTGHLGRAPASPDSDVYKRFVAIFREGSEWASISIPSVGALPFDEDGPYRDIRVTREALVLSGMLGSLEGIVSGTVRQDGSYFPETYLVGGTTRIEP